MHFKDVSSDIISVLIVLLELRVGPKGQLYAERRRREAMGGVWVSEAPQ